jgi:AraC family transcriptional regulator
MDSHGGAGKLSWAMCKLRCAPCLGQVMKRDSGNRERKMAAEKLGKSSPGANLNSITAYRSEYSRRLNRVLDHINAHLAENLTLEALAAVANFSPYHFHRLFSAWMGETLGDYLRRCRVERSANALLARPLDTVLAIALDCGFASGEVFARAFRQRFGMTPTAWRNGGADEWRKLQQAQRKNHQGQGNEGQEMAAASGQDGDALQTRSPSPEKPIMTKPSPVTLITLPEVTVAYMRHIGPYGPAIGDLWRRFNKWRAVHDLSTGRNCYGVAHNDPSITAPEQCLYDACVEVPPGFAGGGDVSTKFLSGGKYAQTEFLGNPRTIGDAWTHFTRDWLPDSGYQFDDRPCFELYRPDHPLDETTGDFGCALCIPIRPL